MCVCVEEGGGVEGEGRGGGCRGERGTAYFSEDAIISYICLSCFLMPLDVY